MTLLDKWRAQFEDKLHAYTVEYMGEKSPMYDAMRYSVLGAGKRVRPLYVRSIAELIGYSDTWDKVEALQVTIELIHCSTLVHDDLPCMDNDVERRGRPTTHIQYGEETALMAGNVLLVLAMDNLAKSLANHSRQDISAHDSPWYYPVSIISKAIVEVCKGQVLDSMGEIDVKMVRGLKTTSLFSAIAEIIGVYGKMPGPTQDSLAKLSMHFGDMFQIRDDILDATGDRARKMRSGSSDQRNNRNTAVKNHNIDSMLEQVNHLHCSTVTIAEDISRVHNGSIEGVRAMLEELKL